MKSGAWDRSPGSLSVSGHSLRAHGQHTSFSRRSWSMSSPWASYVQSPSPSPTNPTLLQSTQGLRCLSPQIRLPNTGNCLHFPAVSLALRLVLSTHQGFNQQLNKHAGLMPKLRELWVTKPGELGNHSWKIILFLMVSTQKFPFCQPKFHLDYGFLGRIYPTSLMDIWASVPGS